MNFLAHAWLARSGSDDFLWGNLVADGIKGSDLSAWPRPVAEGVRHHRRVDAFVDTHRVVDELRQAAPKKQRRYVGIALDMVWDHFIACRLDAPSPLIERAYRVLAEREAPARLATLMPLLIEQDWLHRYADFDFTCKAISGVGQRLSGPNRLGELLPWLQREHALLEQGFQQLWPDVCRALER